VAMVTWAQLKLHLLIDVTSIAIAIVFGLRYDYCATPTMFGNGN